MDSGLWQYPLGTSWWRICHTLSKITIITCGKWAHFLCENKVVTEHLIRTDLAFCFHLFIHFKDPTKVLLPGICRSKFQSQQLTNESQPYLNSSSDRNRSKSELTWRQKLDCRRIEYASYVCHKEGSLSPRSSSLYKRAKRIQ